MTEHVLTLNTCQLYEVYNAAWREFLTLHTQATTNPSGVPRAVIERVRESRESIGQVCAMIEVIAPDMATTDERYATARAQAKTEQEHGIRYAPARCGASFALPDFKSYDLK